MENKKLNFWECMSFCIGQIVGSGVFVLTGIVIGLTGHGAPYGFVLAALISWFQWQLWHPVCLQPEAAMCMLKN